MKFDWSKYWGSQHPSYDKQHQNVWKAVLPLLKGRVLDIGCGSCLMYKDSNIRLTGIDKEPNFLLEAVKNYPEGEYYVAEGIKTRLPDSSYDTILFLGVLDYYNDWRLFLREARRLLNIGGQILIVVMDGFEGRRFNKTGKHLVDNWYLIKLF